MGSGFENEALEKSADNLVQSDITLDKNKSSAQVRTLDKVAFTKNVLKHVPMATEPMAGPISSPADMIQNNSSEKYMLPPRSSGRTIKQPDKLNYSELGGSNE